MSPPPSPAGLLTKLHWWLQYAAVRSITSAVLVLPWGAGRRIGRALGLFFYLADRRSRKVEAVENLRLAFPELTAREARRLVRRVYQHWAEATVDGFHAARRAVHGRWQDLIETTGIEKLQAVAPGTGVVFVTGHYGVWELLGIASRRLGYDVWSVNRPFRNIYVEEYARRVREAEGQHMLPKDGFYRRMVAVVKQGGSVALLVDQDARRHGIFVQFFGRPASTTTAPARLALRTGAPVVFVYARRMPGRNRFVLGVKDVIVPQAGAAPREETARITQRITSCLEELVRETPEQWLWLHRRWKTQPGQYDKAWAERRAARRRARSEAGQ